MTKFVIGFLLGAIVGIAGTSAFLISAGGSDYLILASPKFREIEAQLKQAERERDGMIKRLDQFTELATKLESRFVAMVGRFENLAGQEDSNGRKDTAESPPAPLPTPAVGQTP